MAKKKTHKEFIKDMNLIHPELKVLGQYVNSQTKILIEDNLGIKYSIIPNNLLKGQNVSINSAVDKNNAFKIISEQKHGIGKFDYSKVDYITNDKEIILICNDCKTQFEQVPRRLLFNGGCPNCGIVIRGNNKTKGRSKTIIQDIKKIHKERIGLDQFIFSGMKVKSMFKCNVNSKHEYWEATPDNVIQGKGCPICKSSTGELKIMSILNRNEVSFIRQKTFDNCRLDQLLYFDFYLPKHNMCIEYDGRQHFEPVNLFGGLDGFNKTKKRDKIKNEFCLNENIDLLRIPYTQFNKIENLISNFIKQKMAG